jgi:hypothetical protein
MAMFRVEFNVDNAAFEKQSEGEVAKLLEKTLKKLQEGKTGGHIQDSNGNRVGAWGYYID